MVDRSPHGLSRIPVPVKTTGAVQNGSIDLHLPSQSVNGSSEKENGEASNDVNEKKEKGFETFLMTGDMIIRTTASQKTRRDASSRNASDSSDSCVAADMESLPQTSNDVIEDSPKLTKNFQRSSESGFEDQEQLSGSSTLELQGTGKNEDTKGNPPSFDIMSQSQSSAASSSISSVSSDMKSDISEQTVIHNENDSGLTSPLDESTRDETRPDSPLDDSGNEISEKSTSPEKSDSSEKYEKSKIVTSKSAEKIILDKSGHQLVVRSSKSQELKSDGFALVDIDIDDNMAYSLDQIPQRGSQTIETIDDQVTRSLHNSPEHRNSDKAFIPGFINIEIPKGREASNERDDFNHRHQYDTSVSERYDEESNLSMNDSLNSSSSSRGSERDSFDPSRDPNLLEYQPPSTSVDRPSAQRLAKRLYQLDGFRKSDVSRHLSKK